LVEAAKKPKQHGARLSEAHSWFSRDYTKTAGGHFMREEGASVDYDSDRVHAAVQAVQTNESVDG
jgi:hypothetical protein